MQSTEITYLYRGQAVEVHDLPRGKPAAKSRAAAPEAYHKGFVVKGYKPGAIEAAKKQAAAALEAWQAMTSAQRAEVVKSGDAAPKPFDETVWFRKTKPDTIKRCELVAAAELARELAVRAGWQCVEVIELKRGKVPKGGF